MMDVTKTAIELQLGDRIISTIEGAAFFEMVTGLALEDGRVRVQRNHLSSWDHYDAHTAVRVLPRGLPAPA